MFGTFCRCKMSVASGRQGRTLPQAFYSPCSIFWTGGRLRFKPQQWVLFNSENVPLASGSLEGKSKAGQKRILSALGTFRRMMLFTEDDLWLRVRGKEPQEPDFWMKKAYLSDAYFQKSIRAALQRHGSCAEVEVVRAVRILEKFEDLLVFFHAGIINFPAETLRTIEERSLSALVRKFLSTGGMISVLPADEAADLEKRAKEDLLTLKKESTPTQAKINFSYRGFQTATMNGEAICIPLN